MERFKLLNWNPSLENIIDDVFIRDKRMEKDSAIYKIINGIFTDPFDNIEEDCDKINIQLLKQFGVNGLEEDEDESKDENKYEIKKRIDEQFEQNTKKRQEFKEKQEIIYKKDVPYIPGMRKLPSLFPRKSSLDFNQHAMCVRALSRLFSHQVLISAEEKAELEHYMALQKIISAEQSEFLEFAKKMWNNHDHCCIKHNEYIKCKWNIQLCELKKLPRYYVESSNIPFSSDKNVTVKFVSYLQQGIFPEVILPKCDERYLLMVNKQKLFDKYPPCLSSSSLSHFKLPVSEDIYCTSFAEENKVDLVISSSGLKCLLNNIGSDYSNSWTIPVIIRCHRGKNIAYVDKKLPPVAATSSQKSTWIYKYILRHCLVSTEVKSSEEMTPTEKDIAEVHKKSDDEYSKLFNEYLETQNHNKTNLKEDSSSLINKGQNVTYKLFTIGPTESQNQCKLIKDLPKEYQILIRTKTDGIEVLPNGQLQPVILAPKLEHQLAFGAEAATLEEGLQQWGSLVFRPDTSLARVRLEANSGEIIQIERHTAMSLSTEMKRLHNIKVEDSLTILHNVIERLSCLMPGRYIMRHVVQYGPFAYIYKEAEENAKNSFDLHSIYESEIFKTIPVTPWSPIDTMLLTPALKYFRKMPAMFNPRKIRTFNSSDMTPGTSGVEKCTLRNQSAVEPTDTIIMRQYMTKAVVHPKS